MQWEQPAQHPPGHTPGARAHIFVLCHTPALASGVPVGSLQRARTAHWAVCTPASTGGFSFFLGINIIYRNFDKQRGAYKVILKNRFVFLKNGMHPVVEQIVLWHEIGHDVLHRKEAVAVGGFKEFNIFEMRENRMEYEANIFASQASLPDDTILEYIENGYDIQQIARAMSSDRNLIALKVDTLIAQGYQLRKQEHQNDFLKYSKKI